MKIKCDEEGMKALNELANAALKGEGIKILNIVNMIGTNIKLIEKSDDDKKIVSKNEGKEDTKTLF